MYVCIYIYVCLRMYTYVFTYIFVCVNVCLFVFACLHFCVHEKNLCAHNYVHVFLFSYARDIY